MRTLLFLIATPVLAQTIGTCPVFPADNIWNTPVDTLPVHPNSATYVLTIGSSSGLKADFGAGLWNGGPIGIPFIRVAGTQTKYSATFLYWDESDTGPYAVPLNAPIEGGSNSTGDRHAIAVDHDNCILYELYRAFPQTGSWQADAGAIFNLRSNALRPATWTSADAAGLPIVPGLVRYDEVLAGEIRHALRFTVPQTQRAFLWPGRHYASNLTDPRYPPMGIRFRLKAGFDITPFPSDVQVILRALKKYGMMLSDNGSAWYISGQPDDRWNNSNLALLRNVPGSALEAVDVSSLMIDPDSGQARQAGISISVSPSTANVVTQSTVQFAATVQGSSDQSVTWSVNGIAGGTSQVGSISASGLYTAPAIVPDAASVNVQAASVATPSATGSAAVTVRYPAPSIDGVSPNPIQTGAYTLNVTGVGFQNGSVVRFNGASLPTAYVNGGQLTATGSTSTVASAVPITVLNPDAQLSNAVTIAVVNDAPVSVTVSPASASVRLRKTRQFSATVSNTADIRVTWQVNGITGGNGAVGKISLTGLYAAPVSVPSPAEVTVRAVSVADTTQSGTAAVTITRR